MFKNDKSDSDSNFWISYADLMAGLLFVFILLIGAIVSKSTLLKTELHDKKDKLSVLSHTLEEKEERLNILGKSLEESQTLSAEQKKLLTLKNARIHKDVSKLTEQEKQIKEQNTRLAKAQLLMSKNDKLLKLKLDEIEKLNRLLLKEKTKEDKLKGKIVLVQSLLDEKNEVLKKKTEALAKEKKSLKDYEGKVIVLSNQLKGAKDEAVVKEEKLLMLLSAMDEKKTKYDDLLQKLQAQKAKIKSLTGIKLKVVAALKKALGSKINIDKKTGSLRLASNILFDVGKATLKDEAKVELKTAFEEYIGTLISNKEIKPHLDKIIIEGHTDSDGGYIYNLKLSQQRALAVMEYLLTLDFSKKHNIKPLMTASGRAYLDAIMKDGVEDKEASRRIEIKFRLKNDDAMHEIEKVLDAK